MNCLRQELKQRWSQVPYSSACLQWSETRCQEREFSSQSALPKPAVLLVAYRRGAQGDVDRWLKSLISDWPEVACYEVPTIAGVIWRPLAGWIDSGMRGGVPENKWSSVVTLYGGNATRLRDFLGDHGGPSAYVVMLDANGVVAWFNAEGYSDERARELSEVLRRLTG
jgi:hypothetical protein